MDNENCNNQTYANRRSTLVSVVLDWENTYGIAPSITSAISEIDAADLVGMQIDKHSKSQLEFSKITGIELTPTYSDLMQGKSAVRKGYDFEFRGKKFQVKANRPSGKLGSFVTLAPKPKNLDWDYLIYMLYKQKYELKEAWLWSRKDFEIHLFDKKRISPNHYRAGLKINVDLLHIKALYYEEIKLSKIPQLGEITSESNSNYSYSMIEKFEHYLHQVINSSVREIVRTNKIELPKAQVIFENKNEVIFFKVYGMYGGFKIWLDHTQPKLVMYAYGFCRIHEGSERLYKIDIDGYQLIKVGKELFIS